MLLTRGAYVSLVGMRFVVPRTRPYRRQVLHYNADARTAPPLTFPTSTTTTTTTGSVAMEDIQTLLYTLVAVSAVLYVVRWRTNPVSEHDGVENLNQGSG